MLNLDRGLWYVMLLLTLFAVLGAAAMGTGRGRKLAGVAGPILSFVTAVAVVGLITTHDGRAADASLRRPSPPAAGSGSRRCRCWASPAA